MHDLLHAYSVELASGDPDLRSATERLLDQYVWCSTTAHQTLYAYDNRWLPDIGRRPGVPVPSLSTPDQALAWFDAERRCLVAAIPEALPRLVVDLAAALDRYLNVGAHYPENIAIHEAALVTSRAIGDRAAEVRAKCDLGRTLAQTARYEAVRLLEEAASTAVAIGDGRIRRRALNGLGLVHRRLGDHAQASDLFLQCISSARERRDAYIEASALGNLGRCREDAGQPTAALALYTAALAKHREAKCLSGEGQVRDSMGSVYLRLGRVKDAMEHFTDASQIARKTRSPNSELACLNGLGAVLHASGRPGEARAQYESALHLGHQIGDPTEAARALEGLGDVAQSLDSSVEARVHWTEAMTVYREIGVPQAEQVRAKLAALDEAEHGARRVG